MLVSGWDIFLTKELVVPTGWLGACSGVARYGCAPPGVGPASISEEVQDFRDGGDCFRERRL